MLQRFHTLAVIVAFAGIAALAGLALKFSFQLIFLCLCVSTVAGFLLVGVQQRQRASLEQAGLTLGQFMRGSWGARLQPDSHDDEFTRLQHRLNNMLDAIDLHLRGTDAAIDLSTHADYAEKLRFTALYETLSQHKSFEEIKAERTPTESVGVLLQQLGHNVADLFKSEEREEPVDAGTDPALSQQLAQQSRQMRAALGRLQAASGKMAERAMRPNASEPGRPNAASLDQLMARIAEQATVIALNIAIESGRAAQGSPLADAADELHAIASHLHKARGDMHALMETVLPPEQLTPSVPLSYAIDALATAENALQHQITALEALEEASAPTPMEEAA